MRKLTLLYLSIYCLHFTYTSAYDVTVVGYNLFHDSMGRLTTMFIESLKDTGISINFRPTRPGHWLSLKDMPQYVAHIIQNNTNFTIGKVAILFDLLQDRYQQPFTSVPDSYIKIAYSTLESTAIPPQWVSILNAKFDLVVVPDEFFVKVYKNSGVTIPIFCIAEGMYLDEFLKRPIKSKVGMPFTFGFSAAAHPRKNHLLLIEAFKNAFGKNHRVQLKIHSGVGDMSLKRTIQKSIKGFKNIQFIKRPLMQSQYVDFFASLDCYVMLSKGEGFSLTPREAMALGIPCILSNNTAHITICQTGLVKAIKADRMEQAYYNCFQLIVGYNFNCNQKDVEQALKEVYQNYTKYLAQSADARKWASQYSYKNLTPYYLNLVKPKQVILGDNNKVGKDYFMTNSKALFEKYKKLCS